VRCLVNRAANAPAVPAPSREAATFHAGLPGYRPTPVRALPILAAELGVAAVAVKDESNRLGLPAFKVLGAAWAIERTLRQQPDVDTLVAASAGNHGRAVARVAAARGLRCRVFLPARSAATRRAAIATEGADVIVVDGDYEDALAQARDAAREPGAAEIADVGDSQSARWVIDGYATLFAEAAGQGDYDVILLPVGVGSLAAAAARFAAHTSATVVAIEPVTAACLTASLHAGRTTPVPTPGTTMAGLDCAEISTVAWPVLRDGIHGTVTVDDTEAAAAVRELAETGLAIGESGAAPLAGLRRLITDPNCAALRDTVRIGAISRVLLIATEGATDPDSYRRGTNNTRRSQTGELRRHGSDDWASAAPVK
jgi:diaminopropionate ammonia-lyase